MPRAARDVSIVIGTRSIVSSSDVLTRSNRTGSDPGSVPVPPPVYRPRRVSKIRAPEAPARGRFLFRTRRRSGLDVITRACRDLGVYALAVRHEPRDTTRSRHPVHGRRRRPVARGERVRSRLSRFSRARRVQLFFSRGLSRVYKNCRFLIWLSCFTDVATGDFDRTAL